MATTEVPVSDDAVNFATIWEGVADALPDVIAAAHGTDTHDWATFEDRSARLAGALHAAGVGVEDKIALFLYNGFEYEEAQFAAFKQRAVPCNVNYRYLADELAYLLENADAKVLFFDETLADRVAEVQGRCSLVTLYVQVGGGDLLDGAVHYEDLVADHEPADRMPRSGEDLWFLYTGGTTGNPKAVMWPHDQMIANMTAHYRVLDRDIPTTATEAIEAAIELSGRNRTTKLLAAAPLMHGTSGINALHTLTLGGTVATLASRSFDADELWTTVALHRLTMLTIVGDAFARPMLEALDRAEAAGRPHDLSSVFQIMSSGVMWSQESKQAFLDHKPMTLLDSLGSSESVGQAMQLTRRDQKVANTGRFELGPTTQVITDEGEMVEPGSGEIGRLANRGANPLGYYKDPAKTDETFPTINGIRWSIPGDYATVEADGTITLLGRGSVCINSGGEKIYPEEVEEAVKTHPAVADCNVVGLPDDRWGQTVNAVVAIHDDASVDDDDIIAHTRTQIAAYKAPRRILRTDAFVRSPNGKSDYQWAKAEAERLAGL
ncbi:MAG: acyl-CoA synthetase [Acidimicrobiales bacterium]|nr:MAG: acyl-CoA synthetase [Acidimicrobiales bacterium]